MTTQDRLTATRNALTLMRNARALLVKAQTPKSLERLRLAISSTKGAVRNRDRWAFREQG